VLEIDDFSVVPWSHLLLPQVLIWIGPRIHLHRAHPGRRAAEYASA
jgi:hypothetical protein